MTSSACRLRLAAESVLQRHSLRTRSRPDPRRHGVRRDTCYRLQRQCAALCTQQQEGIIVSIVIIVIVIIIIIININNIVVRRFSVCNFTVQSSGRQSENNLISTLIITFNDTTTTLHDVLSSGRVVSRGSREIKTKRDKYYTVFQKNM